MDYDPSSSEPPVVRSLSDKLVVTGVRVSEAPGVAVSQNEAVNGNMYVVEMAAPVRSWNPPEDSFQDPMTTSSSIMTSFRQRNEILRQALEFPPIVTPAQPQELEQLGNDGLSPPHITSHLPP